MTATAQRAFSGGIISPGMYSRKDVPKFDTGLKDALNVVLRAQGGVANRAGTLLAGGFDNSTVDGHPWLIPFEFSVDDSYQLEFADEVMRVIKSGEYVLTGTARTIVSLTSANPARLEMASAAHASEFPAGSLFYVVDIGGSSALHRTVLKSTAVSGEFVTFETLDGTVDGTDAGWGSLDAAATAQPVFEVVSPYAIEDLPALYPAQDVDTVILTCPGYNPRKLQRGTSDDDWTFTELDFEPDIAAPTGLTATATGPDSGDTSTYVVTAIAANGEKSLPSTSDGASADLFIDGNTNELSWTAVSGAETYHIYKDLSGVYGFIGVSGNTTFSDDNITPDTADNPPSAREPFGETNAQPRVVTFIENRLAFASPPSNPQASELSTSVNPFNFNRALTPGGSDAVSFRMRSQKLNSIEHIVPLEFPVILTAGAEWVLTTQEDAPIQPANFRLRPRSYRGSSSVRPVVIGETLIHVVRDGNTLREFSLRENRDFPSADLTILARHLFRGKTVVSMDYAQAPDSVLWVVFSDGTCLSMTYLEEHEVWGWTRHAFGGVEAKAKQVSVVREGAYDTPYFVVSRTMGGSDRVLVERLDTRELTSVSTSHFVDTGLVYTGSALTSLRGLPHLAGEEVAVLADGSVLEGLSVDAYGCLELPEAADRASVGLGYEAKIVTLPIDFGDQIKDVGSGVGDYRAASEVALQVVDTRGVAVGREGGWLNEYKQFEGDEPIAMETGTIVVPIEGDWERDASLEVSQRYPLPMEITSIVPEWSLGS